MRVIHSTRLRLCPIPPDAARALLEGAVPPGWTFGDGYPSEFSLEVMELVVAHGSAGAGGPFFVMRRLDDAVVGEIGASIDPITRTAQVGYSVVEPCWGQGYATEALRALIADLFAGAEVRHVVAETLVDHVSSRRVMEKAGMTYQTSRSVVEDGQSRDLVCYVKDHEEPVRPGRP